jgi:hypothetical protein
MSQVDIEKLLGRLITDARFRSSASRSLEKTIFKEGLVLTDNELASIKHLEISKFDAIAMSLDGSIIRA